MNPPAAVKNAASRQIGIQSSGVAIAARFTDYAVSGGGGPLYFLQRAADGNVWFVDAGGPTETAVPAIGYITPQGTSVEYSTAGAALGVSGAQPKSILTLVGAESSAQTGHLYFGWAGTNPHNRVSDSGIGSIALNGGAMQLYGIGTNEELPGLVDMAVAPLEATSAGVWGMFGTHNHVAFFNATFPLGSGTINRIPSASGTDNPASDMTIGSDGNVWYADNQLKVAGYVNSSRAYKVAGACGAIAAGNDNNLWLTAFDSVGPAPSRLSYSGAVAQFSVPVGTDCGNNHTQIAAGPDASVWTTGSLGGGLISLVRVASTGAISYYTDPTHGSRSGSVATGSDGNIWFASDVQTITTYRTDHIVSDPGVVSMHVGQSRAIPIGETGRGNPFTAHLTAGGNCSGIAVVPNSAGTVFTVTANATTNPGNPCVLTASDKDGVGFAWIPLHVTR